jgi:hypothetical protein
MKLNIFFPIVIVAFIVLVTSCQKETICVLPENAICQQACEMEPMKGWCGTPPVTMKYYFDQTTQQCEEYIYAGGDVPFETLQECQDCACTRVVGQH